MSTLREILSEAVKGDGYSLALTPGFFRFYRYIYTCTYKLTHTHAHTHAHIHAHAHTHTHTHTHIHIHIHTRIHTHTHMDYSEIGCLEALDINNLLKPVSIAGASAGVP